MQIETDKFANDHIVAMLFAPDADLELVVDSDDDVDACLLRASYIFLVNLSVRSPRNKSILDINNNLFRMNVSQTYFIKFSKLLHARFFVPQYKFLLGYLDAMNAFVYKLLIITGTM